MSLTGSILLPSQEALLNRLQHISLYGQQLIVLTGENGAGKTTLVTALLNELEGFSSALVICPKHCDSAEIRRKILVQLLAEPVFDDELPLPETILRVASALPSASCIVLDDAHYIPLEIWAECIVLSQMSFAGKTVNVTMTSPVDFLNDVLQQLPIDQRQLLLPLDIEPIDCAEREGLYYTLLSRSEAQPFTPRDIVKDRLEAQNGSPKEVVTLLELALNGGAEEPAEKSKAKLFIVGAFVLLTLTLLAWLLMDTEEQTVEQASAVIFAGKPVLNSPFLAEYGERLLAGYLVPQSIAASQNESESRQRLLIDGVDDKLRVEPDLIDSQQLQAVDDSFEDVAQVSTEVSKPLTATHIETFSANSKANPSSVNDGKVVAKVVQKPVQGYTLQLASVKRLDSLARMLDSVKAEKGVMVARYKSRWVVFMGEFGSVKQAREQSLKLTANAKISAPWIRKWQDLSQYELQDRLPIREIKE
ncbi:AAA family ATPase [Shewanella sp. KX20019]|uniref:ATP-binding protein n=1 Tax=Shewanella sp. KX20019 TaxID=2803864 RepID=UPI0019253B66|nr:AAA family ATPase [Shewanella sp. KX20019]QQX80094.1 AAA family ATPase [Shewanella sp. KX20019]